MNAEIGVFLRILGIVQRPVTDGPSTCRFRYLSRPYLVPGLAFPHRRVRGCLEIPEEFVDVWIPEEFVDVWIPLDSPKGVETLQLTCFRRGACQPP